MQLTMQKRSVIRLERMEGREGWLSECKEDSL
jgi:hypothetical protein